MPSADSRYTVGAPCGLLTRWSVAVASFGFVFLSYRVQLTAGQDVIFRRCRGFGKPVIPDSGNFIRQSPEMQRASRGFVLYPLEGYKHVPFCTRAPSIRAWLMAVRGLYPVLRTCPTRPASLDFCASPHAFAVPCLGKATAFPCTVTGYIVVIPLHPSPLPGWVWDLPNISEV